MSRPPGSAAAPPGARFNRIRPDASEQIARELRAHIERGRLQPGDRIDTEHEPATEEFRLADTRFHRVIAVTAGNDLMVTFTGWILDVLQPSLIDHIGEALDGDEIIAQHEHIMRTIRRHQPRAAQRAMHDHIAAVEAVLRRVDSFS